MAVAKEEVLFHFLVFDPNRAFGRQAGGLRLQVSSRVLLLKAADPQADFLALVSDRVLRVDLLVCDPSRAYHPEV